MDDDRKAAQLDRIESRLDSIDVTLVRNTAQLEEHIRRTEILEEEIKPVKAHVSLMNNTAKIIALIAASLVFLKTLGLLDKLF